MIRKNLKVLVITSVVILLPVLAGVILWDKLPGQMPTHWNAAGEIDGWSSKAFSVFALPFILLAAQWLCVLATFADPKKAGYPGKLLNMVFWIIPVLAVVLYAITYSTAMGMKLRIEVILPVVTGLLFAVIGNYLPKFKQNYTVGIKIPWTLNSEENWNRTHRFAGWLWVACSIIIILTGFLGSFWIFMGVVLVMVLAPMIYSYTLYRKGV